MPRSRHRSFSAFVALTVLTSAWGGGQSRLAAEEVWSALGAETWGVYLASAPERPFTVSAFPPGSDLGAPAFSPDGSRLAVEAAGQGIAVCALETGACRRLEGVSGLAARPAWHPRTGELLFALYRFEGGVEDADLWIAGPDLADPRPLVTQTGSQDDPDVSPDGRRLAYSSTHTVLLHRSVPTVVRHLWVLDLVTGEPRLLSEGVVQDLHPDWSPDGTRIAFASDRSGQFEIWLADLEGGGRWQVTSGEGAKTWPVWSPDGETLLFTRLLDGRHELLTVEASATGRETFTPVAPGAAGPRRNADWR